MQAADNVVGVQSAAIAGFEAAIKEDTHSSTLG
jgi:hypothetical protein